MSRPSLPVLPSFNELLTTLPPTVKNSPEQGFSTMHKRSLSMTSPPLFPINHHSQSQYNYPYNVSPRQHTSLPENAMFPRLGAPMMVAPPPHHSLSPYQQSPHQQFQFQSYPQKPVLHHKYSSDSIDEQYKIPSPPCSTSSSLELNETGRMYSISTPSATSSPVSSFPSPPESVDLATSAGAAAAAAGNTKPVRQIVPEAKRKHICKTCARVFTTSGHLARHNRIHTGERKHVCPWPTCDARFARQDNCMQHYKTHSNGKSKRRKYLGSDFNSYDRFTNIKMKVNKIK